MSVQVRWLKIGHVWVAWRVANVTYTPRWAKPAWSFAGYEFGPLADQIGQTLQELGKSTMPTPDPGLATQGIEDALGMPSATWPWLVRWLLRWIYYATCELMERWAQAGSGEGSFFSRAPTIAPPIVEPKATAVADTS